MNNKDLKQKEGNMFDMAISAVAGIATVAAITVAGVAATLMLKDEKNRDKVKKVILDTKDHAVEMADDLKSDLKKEKNKNLN